LNVKLPGRESLEMTVDAESDYWEPTRPCETCPADGIRLYPLPNHVQTFAFNIVNHARVKKTLEVLFLIPDPDRWPDGQIFLPPGAQPEATVKDLLKPFMPLRKLGTKPFKVDLPETGQAVRIKLPASDEQVDPEANLLIPDQSDPKKFKPVSLKHGLLVLFRDLQSKDVTIRRIQIVPQRPGRYLTVTARYDAATERVEILAKANNPDALPEEGIAVSADIEHVSVPKGSKLSGKVTASKDLEMHAYLVGNAPQEITASVQVDKNPRAFIFRIPRGASIDNIPLFNDPAVRIVSPADRTAFNASVGVVPIRIQVDAAEGTFDDDDSTAFIEVGIDEEPNRELEDDKVLTLYSDRQVEIAATRFSPEGTLSLQTKVGDFVRDLPTEGLSDLRANLLARLVINGESKWSDPVEIVLDGAPPEIHVDDMPKQVVSGDDVIIHIRTTQDDLSGVASVEAVFESVGAGDADKIKWEAADDDGKGGWIVSLKTAEQGLGLKTILIRATDKKENVSDPLSESIEIIQKPVTPSTSGKEIQPDVSNTVSGQAHYDNQPARVTVTLVSAAGATTATKNSNDAGEFTFFKVPPGEYVLKARSLEAIRNKHRLAEMKLTVVPRSQASVPVRVSLE
jgi:hypothetical protein